ncbi:MAG: type II toxin-antitoxin system HicB family antitoxin [Candidatus Dadabacteria bacterium]|nr:type II toxin-antitoxin system HicB family antitoxin [Candidatus Dadabacteria bacterium]
MEQIKFDAVVWQEGDVFVSQCLDVDVASYGDTVEDALESLKEAVECHLSGVSDVDVILKNLPDLPFPPEN